MSSAKLYISTDVVDRLTRPIASSSSAAEDSSQQQQQRFDSTSPSGRSSRPGVMNIQSFLGSLQGSAAKAVAQQSPQLSSDEKLKRQLKFESFLNRQKAIMKRKEEQIQQVLYCYLLCIYLMMCDPTHLLTNTHLSPTNTTDSAGHHT